MPTRLSLILAAFAVAPGCGYSCAHAQTAPVCAAAVKPGEVCDCPPPKLQPFTGHVLDDATGKPLAGVTVHFLDSNPPTDRSGTPVRGIIDGRLTTAADGSFQLPANLPLATFTIRVEAPGYYAAVMHDSQRLVGERPNAAFPRPSHEIRMKPSPGLVAIGSSELAGVQNRMPAGDSLTAAAFAPGGGSLVVAARGPGIWLVTLPAGTVRAIELPKRLKTAGTSIQSVGWDGRNLVFFGNQDEAAFVGGASAPDFKVTVLPAPDAKATSLKMGNPFDGRDNFTVEETGDCDGPGAGPHCGQSGNIVARNGETGRVTTVFSGSVGDLSYLHDPMLGGLMAYAEDMPARGLAKAHLNSENMESPGMTLVNLTSRARSHIELPGTWGRHMTLLAERMIPETGVQAMRVAYTVRGDCDPRSTDKAQPGAPSGPLGVTPNDWSVCVVTVPVPVPPQPAVHRDVQRRSPAKR